MQFGKCVLTAVLALASVRTWAVPAPSVSQVVPASSVLPIDVPGSTYTDAIGINNRGDIVGSYDDAQTSRRRGYLRSRGSFTRLDVPDASTIPSGINERGQVVGWYVKNGFHGFLWDRGTFTTIDDPEGSDTFIDRINNRGQMAARLRPDFFSPTRGTLMADGVFSSLNITERVAEVTLGLNDRGQIVGTYLRQGLPAAFLFDDDVFTPIEVPGAVRSTASGISNRGEIVGSYHDANGVEHGYLRSPDGVFTTIDAATPSRLTAMGINDHGDVVGRFEIEGGSFHGFLWSR